jgi:hypothetical protein
MSRRLELQTMHDPIAKAAAELGAATAFMTEAYQRERRAALLGASAYLRIFATAFGAGLLAKGALAAGDDRTGSPAIAKAAFFAQTMLPEVSSLRAAMAGSAAAVGVEAAAWLGGD